MYSLPREATYRPSFSLHSSTIRQEFTLDSDFRWLSTVLAVWGWGNEIVTHADSARQCLWASAIWLNFWRFMHITSDSSMTRTWLELPLRNDGSRWHKTSLLCDMLLLPLQLVSRDVGNGMWQRNAAKEARKGNERENIAWEMKNVRGKPEEGGKLGRCRTDSHLLFHFRNKRKNACELARGLAASLAAIL